MNVKQLKEAIENLPDDMGVFMNERTTEFKYGLVNSVYVKKINFMEEPDGEVLSQDNAVILDEQ